MATHSPTCEQILAELLSTPTDSVSHKLADYVQTHTSQEGMALLLTVVADDPPTSEPTRVALQLLPSIIAEVQA